MTEMYCDLQSRGLKRKFVEDDDSADTRSQRLAASDAIAAVAESLAVASKLEPNSGSVPSKHSIQTTITARILEHSLNASAQHCYVRQRQQIFNISICKLNRFRQSSDPSLLRSVLVCNGLKALERELAREGIKINFGPHGVSFTPPVSNTHNMTLDPPPTALNALVNQNNNTNNNLLNNNSFNSNNNNNNSNTNTNSNSDSDSNHTDRNQSEAMKRSTDASTFAQIGNQSDEMNDSPNGEYDKYLQDLYPSSGRVTPFHKTQSCPSSPVYEAVADSPMDSDSDSDFSSTSLSQSANSAFWGSDDASDRLTQLNWSSVFNSSLTTSSGANKVSGQSSRSGQDEVANSTCKSATSPSSSQFTTLLPPSASTSSSTTSTTTTTPSVSTSSLPLSSTSVSSASLSQNVPSMSSQVVNSINGANSQAVNQLSVINANSISLSTTTTNDEIFGDIDLSLYDFDLLTPLSPPNVKLAPITAEELIRNISSSDSNCSISSMSSSSSNITIATSSLSLPLSSPVSSSSLATTGSPIYSSSNSSGFHGRYFRQSSDKLFSDDRDQHSITPVMS